MLAVRTSGDLIAILEGAMWLMLAWSTSYSVAKGVPLPTVAALSLVATVIFVCWAHRPFRFVLQRYRIRRRRTEMLMHIVALPLLLALILGSIIEVLLFPLNGAQKMLLFNVLASASWLVFGMTLIVKYVLFRLERRRHQS